MQIEAKVCTQRQAFEAAVAFARAEGLVPSPESSYAVKVVADEALACKEKNERKNILFVMNGNSNLDVATFKEFFEGAVEDQQFAEEQVQAALERLPNVGTS